MVEGDVAAHRGPGDHHAEEEQDDDRPDVDQDQRQRDELGRQQEEHPGHRGRGSHQKQGGPDHVLRGDHPDRRVDQEQSQHDVDPVDGWEANRRESRGSAGAPRCVRDQLTHSTATQRQLRGLGTVASQSWSRSMSCIIFPIDCSEYS